MDQHPMVSADRGVCVSTGPMEPNFEVSASLTLRTKSPLTLRRRGYGVSRGPMEPKNVEVARGALGERTYLWQPSAQHRMSSSAIAASRSTRTARGPDRPGPALGSVSSCSTMPLAFSKTHGDELTLPCAAHPN